MLLSDRRLPKRSPTGVNETIEQITARNIESILCDEDRRRSETPWLYRSVARLAARCGTVSFVLVHVAFFTGWIVFNLGPLAFDPYPYTFLLFGVSIEAIFLSLMVLISQNLASVESERRHHLDLQINLLNERETTAIMRLLTELAGHAGVPSTRQEEVRDLAHDTDPAAVLDQIAAAEAKRQHAPT